ncbi:MAG: 50S ribosomal protein L17 [Candidatus Omnitrophica bacterium]|nr:50S ribosomal protein L17 [Candidatus Omnitrophota bacterium]
MRHRKKSRKLNRTTSERKALLRSLVRALFKKQRIVTTLPKAKEARRLAERVITLGKHLDISNQRRIFSILLDRSLVKEIANEIAPRFKNRQGGYTRIVRLAKRRKGDNAEMALLELTEQKIIAPALKKARKEKKSEAIEAKPEKSLKEETPPLQAPSKKEESTPHRKEEKHPPQEERRPHHIEKPKSGFFQGIKRFLRPKTKTDRG